MTRQTARAEARAAAKQEQYQASGHGKKVGPGRRVKWLQRHPKVAGYYSMAIRILQENDRAQLPSWRAIRKMMVVLATSPRIAMPGVGGAIPAPLHLARHQRPSWRSYPHQVIDANLQVAS